MRLAYSHSVSFRRDGSDIEKAHTEFGAGFFYLSNSLDKFIFVLAGQIAVLLSNRRTISGFVHILLQVGARGGGGALAFSHGAVDDRFGHDIRRFDGVFRFLAQVAHAVGERVQLLLDGVARRFDAIFDAFDDMASGFAGLYQKPWLWRVRRCDLRRMPPKT